MRSWAGFLLLLALPALLTPMVDAPGSLAAAALVFSLATLLHIGSRNTIPAGPATTVSFEAAAKASCAGAERVTNLPHLPRLPRAPGLA